MRISKYNFIHTVFLILFTVGVCRADVTIGSGGSGRSLPNSADAGGVIFTQILSNNAWPGKRPSGMETRLHYPVGVVPTDDQMLIDVILHVDGGLGGAAIAFLKNTTGEIVVVPSQGALDRATWPDRMYLALAMLKRSANYPLSKPSFTEDDLLPYINLEQYDYRLLNHFRLHTSLSSGGLPGNDSIIEQDAIIGPTPFHINNTVYVTVQHGIAIPSFRSIVPIDPGLMGTICIPNNVFKSMVAIPLYGNDQVQSLPPGWAGGSGGRRIAHRNASRIGPLLIDDEHYILNEDGSVPIGTMELSPFWNEIVFDLENGFYKKTALTCNQQAVVRTDWNYLANNNNWPTHYIYWYDFKLHEYTIQEKRPQAPSPFNGWMKLPTGVLPPRL